jgi:hypothetical protein
MMISMMMISMPFLVVFLSLIIQKRTTNRRDRPRRKVEIAMITATMTALIVSLRLNLAARLEIRTKLVGVEVVLNTAATIAMTIGMAPMTATETDMAAAPEIVENMVVHGIGAVMEVVPAIKVDTVRAPVTEVDTAVPVTAAIMLAVVAATVLSMVVLAIAEVITAIAIVMMTTGIPAVAREFAAPLPMTITAGLRPRSGGEGMTTTWQMLRPPARIWMTVY